MDRLQACVYGLMTDKYRGFIPGLIKVFLFILSLFYGLAVKIAVFFCRIRSCRLNCKVISVGNITLGGTGKTSLVEYIARYLKQQEHKVAVLSRGYKRISCQPNTKHQTPNTKTMGDEPYMLSQKLGDIQVIVDKNRIRGAKRAIKDYGVDTVILDDGFQQWKIKKDLEIACIDATDPFGNRKILPRGILREPLSALKRADVIILTKTNINPDIQDIKDFLGQVNPRALILESMHQPIGFYGLGKADELLAPESLKGKTVTLFCGIGDPDSFENLILSLGVNIGLSFRFPDHHYYTKEDLAKIISASQEKKIDTIITTEKDAVRFCNSQLTTHNSQLLVLRIELAFKNEPEFRRRLLSLYSA